MKIVDPAISNRLIDERIITGAKIHSYTLYNPECRMKQFFNYLQHPHKATKGEKAAMCSLPAEDHHCSNCLNPMKKGVI